jgi:uncharacterized protein YndB with AHSA1/START domain
MLGSSEPFTDTDTTMSRKWARPVRDSTGVYTWRATWRAGDVTLGGGVTTDLITRARTGDRGIRELRETFDAESEHSVEQPRQGWQAILDTFARHVEAYR